MLGTLIDIPCHKIRPQNHVQHNVGDMVIVLIPIVMNLGWLIRWKFSDQRNMVDQSSSTWVAYLKWVRLGPISQASRTCTRIMFLGRLVAWTYHLINFIRQDIRTSLYPRLSEFCRYRMWFLEFLILNLPYYRTEHEEKNIIVKIWMAEASGWSMTLYGTSTDVIWIH